MGSDSPFSMDFELRGFDCGYGGPLKVLPLLNFLQECAGANADAMGVGVSRLLEDGRTWMLSRIDLEIDELPGSGERVRVETWPAGAERLFALRDFVARGGDGRALVRAVFAYLVVDLAARRPLRPESVFGGTAPRGPAPHPVPAHAFSVPRLDGLERSFAIAASPRHIDINGHVNNTHIVDWLVDAVPVGLRGRGLSAFRVEFLAELMAGDGLEALWRAADGEGAIPGRAVVVELRRNGEAVARALTRWRPA
jgi:medium-chain acyl-[acyl-carrier-protein] hydrolase